MKKNNLVPLIQGISETHRSQFDERRNYEWKVLITNLGVYAVVLGAKFTGDITLPDFPMFYILAWLLS
jgi:hypothetical protein